MNRKERIELLARKNRGADIVEDYLKELSLVISNSVTTDDLLQLEKSSILEKSFRNQSSEAYDGKKRAFIKQYSLDEEEGLKDVLLDFSRGLGQEEVLIFNKKTELIGGIKLKSSLVFWFAIKLLLFDGDSLSVSAIDAENGILLDYFEDHSGGAPSMKYELLVWGEEWLDLLSRDKKL